MDQNLKKALVDWGLNDKEARVYLAAIELGSATVNDLAKRTRIFRTYCYDILRSLQERGLVSTITRKGVQYFEAASPDKLVTLLDERKSRIREVLPSLKVLKGTAGPMPKAVLFEGAEGIKSIHEEILAANAESYVIGSTVKIVEFLGPYFDLYVKRRSEKGLAAHVITDDLPETLKKVGVKAKSELRDVRFSKRLRNNNTTCYFYDGKVAIITYEAEPFGVVIESKALFDTFKLFFEELWKSTPPN